MGRGRECYNCHRSLKWRGTADMEGESLSEGLTFGILFRLFTTANPSKEKPEAGEHDCHHGHQMLKNW